jgi:hypothetical protein
MAIKDPRFVPKKVEDERKANPIAGKDINNNTILTKHIADGSITAEKFAPGAVATASTTDGSITTIKIANSAVTPSKLSTDWPIFYAYYQTGAFNTVTGRFGDSTKPIFSSTRYNGGNCYSTSTGRFIVPTTGIYEFNLALLHRYSSAAGSLEPTFYVDGSNINNRGCAFSYVTQSNDHDWIYTSVILSLTVGQYVQCGIHAITTGTDYYYGENLGYFSGKQLR